MPAIVSLSSLFTATTTQGGTFATTSADVVIQGDVAQINALGAHSFTYTVDNGVCPAVTSAAVDITLESQTATWDGPSGFCLSDAPVDVSTYLPAGTTAGGTFSISPDNGNLAASIWTVSAEAAGLYELTYSVAASATCPAVSHTEIITITDCSCNITGTVSAAGVICNGGVREVLV